MRKDKIIKGNTFDWDLVIGIETHAQMQTKSKLFSSSSTKFGSEQNSNVSFIDAAMPGTLPQKINRACVKAAVRAGLALRCNIEKFSVFDRKNYFYPDLPKGYQISQYYRPIARNGILEVKDGEDRFKVRINRIHIEEDAGKSIHDIAPDQTFVDLNRSGIGLLEIVTEPDIRSPEEACAYVKELRSILRYTDVCDGNMEQGSFRCDVNISLKKAGTSEFGNRVEVKNINSIRNVKNAILFEIDRQVALLEAGEEIIVETRLFDAATSTTRSMRKKESVADYRYFPEPNLLPVKITDEYIEEIKASMPELPTQKANRYINEFGLSEYDAEIVTSDKQVAIFFEEVNSYCNDPKMVANWISAELFKNLNKMAIEISDLPFQSKDFADLLLMIKDNSISGKIAKGVLELMFESGEAPMQIVKAKGLAQSNDTSEIEGWVESVLAANEDEVARYRAGEGKLLGFFMGEVMKLSRGKANPSSVNKSLKEALSVKSS